MKGWRQMKGLGRAGSGVVAGGTAAVVVATLGVTASVAAWTDTEYVQGSIGSIDCTDNRAFDSTAWGKFLAAFVLGADISPILDFEGLTVESAFPYSSASGADAEQLGDQAWASELNLLALSSVEVSTGVTLFEAPDLGLYTQYGQAFQSGQSTGAAGLLTTAEGGVSLGSSDPEPPGVGSLDLAAVLDEAIGDSELDPEQLVDVGIDLGAVAGLSSLDACDAVWDGADLTDIEEMEPYLVRDYLISALTMDFGSSLVEDLVDGVTEEVGTLEDALDAIVDQDGLTGDLLTSVTGLVNDVIADLDELLGEASPLAGGLFTAATIDIDFDTTPLLDLLDDAYTSDDGAVTIDLDTNTVTADLDALIGGINDLPPNSSLLDADVLEAISAGVGGALANFVEDHLTPAVLDLLENATVTVVLDSSAGIEVLEVIEEDVTFRTTIAGSVASFLGQGEPPQVSTEITSGTVLLDLLEDAVPGIVDGLLGDVGDALTTGVEDALVTLLPAIGDAVLVPLQADGSAVETATDALLDAVTGTVIPELLEGLDPVLDLLGALIQLSVNVQPDQGGDVPFPAPPTNDAVPGQWFESALRLALFDFFEEPLLSVYLGSGSAGLNEPAP